MRTPAELFGAMEAGDIDEKSGTDYYIFMREHAEQARGNLASALLQRIEVEKPGSRAHITVPSRLEIPAHLQSADRPALRALEEVAHADIPSHDDSPEALEKLHPQLQLHSLVRKETQAPLYTIIQSIWGDLQVLQRQKRLPQRVETYISPAFGRRSTDPIALNEDLPVRFNSPNARVTAHILRLLMTYACNDVLAERIFLARAGLERNQDVAEASNTVDDILSVRNSSALEAMSAGFNSAISLSIETAHALCAKMLRDDPSVTKEQLLAALDQHRTFVLRHAGFHMPAFVGVLKFCFEPVDAAMNEQLRISGAKHVDAMEAEGPAPTTHASLRDDATVLRYRDGAPPLLDYNEKFFTEQMLHFMKAPVMRFGCPAREIHKSFGDWCIAAYGDVVLPQLLKDAE